MVEEWKEIEGFSRYKVSNTGRVWDTKNDKEVAQVLAGKPQYYYVNVFRDDGERKLERVHRFVAKAFVEGQSEQFNVVDHIDRDKFNNHYTNLRWTDRKGNLRNTDRHVTVKDESLVDFVKKYENPYAAYQWILRSRDSYDNIQKCVESYEISLIYGSQNEKIIWKGESRYLLDVCKELDKDYDKVQARLNENFPVWNAMYDVRPSHHFSVEISINGVVGLWCKNKNILATHCGMSLDALNLRLDKYQTLDEVISHDPLAIHRRTVLGVIGTLPEIYKHFGVEESLVKTRMQRYDMTLEEALTQSKKKIKVIYLNGERMTTKAMYEHFNIDAKRANKTRSKKGFTIHETLEHFGIDTSNMDLKY